MGPRASRFALVFWMALAVAAIILAIKPWAGAARFAEQVGSANSGAGHHLPAATLEGVLKIVLVVGGNQRLPTSHQARRDKCPLPPSSSARKTRFSRSCI